MLRLGRNVGIFERRTTTQQAVVEAITAGVPTKVSGIPSTARRRPHDRRATSSAPIARRSRRGGATPGRARRALAAGLANLRTGNLGPAPIIVGQILVVILFGLTATNFFTAVNFINLINQTAGTAMLAFGVVFVLLLGEIDLSIGYLAGIGALVVAELQLPGSGHQ